MFEEEARAWIEQRFEPQRVSLLDQYVGLIEAEMQRQNLVSRESFQSIWVRHLLDSAQLVIPAQRWCDVGSGAGLPGMVIAILSDTRTCLVEPRKLRANFLSFVISELRLGSRVSVVPEKVERHKASPYDVISARAVASLGLLFTMASHLAGPATKWILPRGRSFEAEIDSVKDRWDGMFHVKQSVADPFGVVVTVTGVVPK